jgi:N-acetylmuramoyl-L-alanine amidase
VISIHQNSFVKGAERGAQVFYSIGCDKDGISCKIANIVQARLNQELDGTDRKVKSGDFYIVKKTQFPSILVECGFITTREDELLLVTPEYQQKVANLIFEGILESKQKVLDVQKHIL